MIKADAKLHIEVIPLGCLLVNEFEQRYPERLQHYIDLLNAHPGSYAGFLSVVPSDTYPGLFCILDGHHRFCAAILTGRKDVLAVVIEE